MGVKSPVRSKRGSAIGPAGQPTAMPLLPKSRKLSVFLHSIWKKLTRRKMMRRKRKMKRMRWEVAATASNLSHTLVHDMIWMSEGRELSCPVWGRIRLESKLGR